MHVFDVQYLCWHDVESMQPERNTVVGITNLFSLLNPHVGRDEAPHITITSYEIERMKQPLSTPQQCYCVHRFHIVTLFFTKYGGG